MTASIISLPTAHKVCVEPGQNRVCDPFDAYTGCLMSAGYALSGALLAPALQDEMKYLAKFVDDAALLARIAVHPARERLSKFLLGYTLLEHARAQLWYEIEDLLSSSESV